MLLETIVSENERVGKHFFAYFRVFFGVISWEDNPKSH